MKIKVLLVDDDPYVREGVRSCLSRYLQFDIVGEASNGQDAIARVKKLTPDVVVMNISLPGMDGLETTRYLRESFPKVRVLILAGNQSKEMVKHVVRSGAPGYLSKSASPTELALAIEQVHRGETFFTADVAQAFFEEFVQNGGRLPDSGPKPLSPRERQVLGLIVEGLPNKEVATHLKLSVRTVEKHRQRVMRKLGVRRATELVKFAVTRGWVDLNSAMQ
ncbi:MAG TPA: response regulator transcription factor [Candidatus Limnocylindria bacterium]|nr:response regulator transcription factor [Candidatus Limnocylindria bacterium]